MCMQRRRAGRAPVDVGELPTFQGRRPRGAQDAAEQDRPDPRQLEQLGDRSQVLCLRADEDKRRDIGQVQLRDQVSRRVRPHWEDRRRARRAHFRRLEDKRPVLQRRPIGAAVRDRPQHVDHRVARGKLPGRWSDVVRTPWAAPGWRGEGAGESPQPGVRQTEPSCWCRKTKSPSVCRP